MKWLLFVLMSVFIVLSFLAPPAAHFPEPELARIIFFHLPCAFATVVYVLFVTYNSFKYLSTKDLLWEHRAVSANSIAFAVSIVTMLSGMLFSKVQWGAWWHWDPRQTSFLIVLILLGSYFALRMAFEDEILRARVSATYMTLALLPILFLVFVFPRLPSVVRNSLHPSTTVQSGGFSKEYWFVILGIFGCLLVYLGWLYKLQVSAATLEQRLVNNNGNMETLNVRTTAHRVDSSIRPDGQA